MEPQISAALRCCLTLVIYHMFHCVPLAQNVGTPEIGSCSVKYFCFCVRSKPVGFARNTDYCRLLLAVCSPDGSPRSVSGRRPSNCLLGLTRFSTFFRNFEHQNTNEERIKFRGYFLCCHVENTARFQDPSYHSFILTDDTDGGAKSTMCVLRI